MANAYGIMSGMFANRGGYGGGGGGGNEQEDAYYRAQLQEWLRQQKYQEVLDERNYQEQKANDLAQYLPGALDQAMQTSGYEAPAPTRAGLEVLKAFINSRNPDLLSSINQMGVKAQAGLVSAGTPTQAYKDFLAAQQDEAYAQDRERQRQASAPAVLQISDALAQAQGRPQRSVDDIMTAGKFMTPDKAAALEAAKTGAATDTKAVVEGVLNTPKALQQYDDMVGNVDRMQSVIGSMRDKLKQDPSIVGWRSFVTKYVPESEAKSFANLRQNLVSSLALENMQKLKQLSASGATGFGALSGPELAVLQDSIAKLDVDSDPATVAAALDTIEATLSKVKEGAVRSYVQDAAWLDEHKQYAPRAYKNPTQPLNDMTSTFENARNRIGGQQPTPSGRFKLIR